MTRVDAHMDLHVENVPTIPDHELLRVIGRGSYGNVWLARNIMGSWRAVKVVKRQSFDSERPYEREFQGIRRGENLSRSHPCLVSILHIGRNDEDGYFYYVMELADGLREAAAEDVEKYQPQTVAARIQTEGALSAEDCLTIVTNIAGALAHLHDNRLVHRDVKPCNLLYFINSPKLGDLGLMSDAGRAQSYVGTEGFVPAEGPGEAAGDIFALGKTLYEALTGYGCERYPEVPLCWHERKDFAQRLEINGIVLRACDPARERRYQSAHEILADAALIAGGGSLRKKRRMENALIRARQALIAIAALCVIVAAALIWQSRENALMRETLARTESEVIAARAQDEAKLAKWYGLQDQVRAARANLEAGSVTQGLAAIREAARFRLSPELRNDAAYLLGRPDLVPMPGGTFAPADQFILINLEQDQYLKIPYRKRTSSEQRGDRISQMISLRDGSSLPMPPDFVKKHGWGLSFKEGGTVLEDELGHRWPVPGSQLREDVNPQAHQGSWSLRITPNEKGGHVMQPEFLGQTKPFPEQIKAAGGLTTTFLEPPNMLASSDWSNTLWVDDLALGSTSLFITHGGWPLLYDANKRRLAFHGWEFSEAWIYDWKPSPVLQRVPLLDEGFTGMGFTQDSQWLYVNHSKQIRWWKLGAEAAREVSSEMLPGNIITFCQGAGNTNAYCLVEGSLRKYDFSATGRNTPFLRGGIATKIHIDDMPALHLQKYQNGSSVPRCQALPINEKNPLEKLEALNISRDGRLTAIGGYGPVGVWRDGKLWRRFQVNESPFFGDGLRLDISPDNRYIAIGSFHAGGLWIWELEGRDGMATLVHEENFTSSARPVFSSNGKWLGIAGDTEYRVLSTKDWSILKKWPRKRLHEGYTCFSDDSKILVYQKNRNDITLVRTDTWDELVTLQSPEMDLLSLLALSPDGRWLTANSNNGKGILLWDLQSLEHELTQLGVGW